VFDPGLGAFVRVGFLFSRYGLRLARFPKKGFAQKQAARGTSRAGMPRTYSRPSAEVKVKQGENEMNSKDLAEKGEWRVANGE
jgi:hypothetical protein